MSERIPATKLIGEGLREDRGSLGDLSGDLTIPQDLDGGVRVVSREFGLLAGVDLIALGFGLVDPEVTVVPQIEDGTRIEPGSEIATIHGSVRSLLLGERTILNLLSHLCGIATLTDRFVAKTAGHLAHIVDTRKTLPGYRAIQKYAVRCGGGQNHRFGLDDGIIIKDNHIAAWTRSHPGETLANLITSVRAQLPIAVFIEIEVDTLSQLRACLPGQPDWVLLDNFSTDALQSAVAIRDAEFPEVRLEASGGVRLKTVTDIASTGVDRISVGALTHSAVGLDLGFDWID